MGSYDQVLQMVDDDPDLDRAGLVKAMLSDAPPANVLGETEFAGLYRRPMVFEEAGSVNIGHTHNFDHWTVLHQGSVMVKYRNTETEDPFKTATFEAVSFIKIGAKVHHEIIALEDNTLVTCMFGRQPGVGWLEAAG